MHMSLCWHPAAGVHPGGSGCGVVKCCGLLTARQHGGPPAQPGSGAQLTSLPCLLCQPPLHPYHAPTLLPQLVRKMGFHTDKPFVMCRPVGEHASW